MDNAIAEIALDMLRWGGGLLGIAAVKLLWDLNQKMTASLARLETHDDRISRLEKHVENIYQSFMSRMEVLEALKRIELYMENSILKSKAEARNAQDHRS